MKSCEVVEAKFLETRTLIAQLIDACALTQKSNIDSSLVNQAVKKYTAFEQKKLERKIKFNKSDEVNMRNRISKIVSDYNKALQANPSLIGSLYQSGIETVASLPYFSRFVRKLANEVNEEAKLTTT